LVFILGVQKYKFFDTKKQEKFLSKELQKAMATQK